MNLTLTDDASNVDDTDSFTTGAHLHTDFDPSTVTFEPPHADSGDDEEDGEDDEPEKETS